MFESVGWGEIVVLVVAGLFILGPERLPSAAAWVGRSVRQVKEFANGEGRGVLRVLEQKEVRRLRTYPNAALVLEAAEGYYFDKGYAGEPVVASRIRGQHGYLPERYYTSFIASGAGVTRRGSFGTIRLIDEGPTIAGALGLRLRHAAGRALSLK